LKSKRLFSFLLVMLLSFSLALAGCSGGEETSSNTANNDTEEDTNNESSESTEDDAANSDEPVTITYGTWMGDEELKPIIEAFEASHPNIKVEKEESVTWPWNEKLAAAAAAGKLPDVFWTFGVPTAMANGWLEDLTPYLEADDEYSRENTFGNLIDTVNYEGHQYALPHALHAIGIFVNKDLFNKGNVPLPDASWTLDDMRRLAVKLTNYNEHQFGLQDPRGYREALPSQFDNSLEWGTWDGEKYNFNSPAYTDAMNYVNTLWNEDKVSPNFYDEEERQKWYGKDKDPWTLGKIAMKYDATWGFKGNHENNKFDWMMLPVPGVDGNGRTPLVADYMGISKNSEHKEAAFEFLKWLTYSKEGWIERKEAGASTNSIPIVNDEEVWEAYLSAEWIPEGTEEIIKQIPNGTVDPLKWQPGYTEALGIIGEMNKKLDSGEAKPSDIAAELDQKTNDTYRTAVEKMKEAMNQ
jgi:multiple sugar transport system substrate-binding protein